MADDKQLIEILETKLLKAEAALIKCERFIRGFEGDDMQDEPVEPLLAEIRELIYVK